MKKLPDIYKSIISNKVKNNEEVFYSSYENKINSSNSNKPVNEVLDELFKSRGYIYNIPVIIKTNEKVYETQIVAKVNKYLLTLDNEKILLNSITSIIKKDQ